MLTTEATNRSNEIDGRENATKYDTLAYLLLQGRWVICTILAWKDETDISVTPHNTNTIEVVSVDRLRIWAK